MAAQSEYVHFLKELFPTAGPELARLFQGAADNASLLRSDFQTIRDWLQNAGYTDRAEAHALLLLMQIALEEGSLCIEIAPAPLARRLRDLVPEKDANDWARRIEAALAAPGFPALIGNEPNDSRPVIAHASGARRFLYFQKYLLAEREFQAALSQRLASERTFGAANWPTIVREVLGESAFPFDPDQQMALGAALLNDLAIISGGPGTGKTSIVLSLLRCLIRGGVPAERIALAAPTGRAAQRLTDTLRSAPTDDASLSQLSATTLHHLLAFRPSRNVFARHRENPIPADVVIVDEVSMVGVVLMSQLLQALAPGARLILLGDKDQLPSVDAGAVLAHLVPDDFHNGFHGEIAKHLAEIFPAVPVPRLKSASPLQNRIVLLQTNHRSQAEIRTAAQAINRQDARLVERLPELKLADGVRLDLQSGCMLMEQTLASAAELHAFLRRWIDEAYFQTRVDGRTFAEWLDFTETTDASQLKSLFSLMDRYRLLTLVRDGPWGCDEINSFLQLILRPRLDRDASSALFVGAPVLITRNDAARGLFNGDVGITLRDRIGALRVVFDRHDGAVSFPADALPSHELGFALTVHKSQGSEYRNVMIVLPPTGGRRLLTKELIYTGITRAKSLAVICSTTEALRFAIGRKIERESGILSPS